MDTFRRLTPVTVLVCAAAVLVLITKSMEAADNFELTILHTSDLHGQVLPFDDSRDRGAPGSLARVSAAVTAIRTSTDHPVLLLDSGDTIQGTPFEEMTHVRWREASPTIEAMNRIAYAAMAVGNHEFNFGLDPLRRAEAQAEFPFLAANAIEVTTGKPAFQPFLVTQFGGLKVGLLGLVTPNIPGWEEPAHYEGLAFQPMDEAARYWVPLLRDKERCDLVIVLAHTGIEVDPETGEADGTAYENFGDRLARVPGIDLLLTGHAHQNLPPRLLHGTIVSQPSARGRVMTRIDLELDRTGESPASIVSWHGENIDLGASEVDQALVENFEPQHRRVVEALALPVTVVDRVVTVRGCRLRDCAAQDLIHQVQLKASGADLSLASLLTGGTPDLPPGPVTSRWVSSLYVYPNTLRSVRLNGAQVKDVLEFSARYYDGVECPPTGPCVVIVDPDVRHYNIDTMQGLSYRIDPTRPEGDRVRDLRRNGRPLDLQADFTLVCNNYRAAGGGGYPHLAEAEVIWRSPKEVASMIDDYLAGLKRWSPEADMNWVIAPEIFEEKRPDHNEK
ncbi:MAG: bifunctional UDP-sugar hydrolase/5'-nucleotidase [Acidobacteriota bacterium]